MDCILKKCFYHWAEECKQSCDETNNDYMNYVRSFYMVFPLLETIDNVEYVNDFMEKNYHWLAESEPFLHLHRFNPKKDFREFFFFIHLINQIRMNGNQITNYIKVYHIIGSGAFNNETTLVTITFGSLRDTWKESIRQMDKTFDCPICPAAIRIEFFEDRRICEKITALFISDLNEDVSQPILSDIYSKYFYFKISYIFNEIYNMGALRTLYHFYKNEQDKFEKNASIALLMLKNTVQTQSSSLPISLNSQLPTYHDCIFNLCRKTLPDNKVIFELSLKRERRFTRIHESAVMESSSEPVEQHDGRKRRRNKVHVGQKPVLIHKLP